MQGEVAAEEHHHANLVQIDSITQHDWGIDCCIRHVLGNILVVELDDKIETNIGDDQADSEDHVQFTLQHGITCRDVCVLQLHQHVQAHPHVQSLHQHQRKEVHH